MSKNKLECYQNWVRNFIVINGAGSPTHGLPVIVPRSVWIDVKENYEKLDLNVWEYVLIFESKPSNVNSSNVKRPICGKENSFDYDKLRISN